MFPIDSHIKLLIFDCDGTLIDTTPQHYLAWRSAYGEVGDDFISQEEHIANFSGTFSTQIAKIYNERYNHPIDHHEMARKKEKIFFDEYADKVLAIEKTVAIVKQYKDKLPMVVASNGYNYAVHGMLKATGLYDYFNTIITLEDVKNGKPDPEMFLKAAKLYDVSPTECLVFEDSHTGFEAAKRAGMAVIDVATLT